MLLKLSFQKRSFCIQAITIKCIFLIIMEKFLRLFTKVWKFCHTVFKNICSNSVNLMFIIKTVRFSKMQIQNKSKILKTFVTLKKLQIQMMCVILPVDEQDLEKCESPAFGFGALLVFPFKAKQKSS